VDVVSRRAGADTASLWSSDGQGAYTIQPFDAAEAPTRGTRVILRLKEDASAYTGAWKVESTIKSQSGHVPVRIFLKETPDAEPRQIADGAALWTKPKAQVTAEEYKDFYKSVAGQYDDPALTLHYRAEGLHDYSVLIFVPETKPFDLFDPDRTGHIKLYVRRVFITDDAQILPRYLRFARGLARDDPGKPTVGRHPERRLEPHPLRTGQAGRRRDGRGGRALCEDLGELWLRAEGRPL
jgi:molecular chaperone HtpG